MNKANGSNLLVDWSNFHDDVGSNMDRAALTKGLSPTLPKRDTKKRVAFEPNASYRVVEHHSAFSPREISSVWYQDAEFDDFRKDVKRSARAMAKGRQEGTEIVRSRSNPELASACKTRVYCYRGKSCHMPVECSFSSIFA